MFAGAAFAHLILEFLGAALALEYYRRLRARTQDAIGDGNRMSLLIAAAAGAFFGSRLLGALEQPALFLSGGGAVGPLYYVTAKTIVGGLLGGLFGVELAKRFLGVRSRSGDVYVYPLLLAMMIGRVGCFLMGTQEPTYGVATELWVGMDLGDGVRRHATALYEIVFLGSLWLLLRWVERRWVLRSGRLFMLFLSGYLIYRFAIGFLQPMTVIYGLGAIQWACLLGLAWLAYDWWPRHEG